MASEAYVRAIARVVTAQLAQSAGFEVMQSSASEALSDLLLRYVAEIGAATRSYAELAGRASPNINDVLLAFDNLGISLEEQRRFTQTTEEVQFAQPLPQFPLQRPPRQAPSFAEAGEVPPAHIPAYLPAFPDKHTYVTTPAYAPHSTDPLDHTAAKLKAQRAGEAAVIRLHELGQPPGDPLVPLLTPMGGQLPQAGEAAGEAGAGAGDGPVAPQPGPEGTVGGVPRGAVAAAPPGTAQGDPQQQQQQQTRREEGQGRREGSSLNPFLAAPLWEDGFREESFFKGEGSQSEPASLPLALEAPPVADGVQGEWMDLEGEMVKGAPGLAPVLPFALDFAGQLRRTALSAVSRAPFEDAFSLHQEVEPINRGTKRAKKSRRGLSGSSQDPVHVRAEEILATGSIPGNPEDDVKEDK